MRHFLTALSVFLMMALPARSQILGAELLPSQNGDSIGFTGISYHYCTDSISPTDSFTAYIVSGSGDTLIQDFRSSSIQTDTLKNCGTCDCFKTCSTPSIVRTQFTYKLDLLKLGLKNTCHVKAFFNPGLRAQRIDYAPKAQKTYLVVSAFISTCTARKKRSFEFVLPPKFYGLEDDYFIHSGGFRQIFGDTLGHRDSISCSNASLYSAPFSTVDYKSGYGSQEPLPYNGYPNKANAFPRGFHLNQHTGDFRFIPTDTGTSILKMAFTAYDSTITAYAEREWLVNIRSASGESVPLLTGLGLTSFLEASNYEFNLCFNESSEKAIRVIDKNGPGIDFSFHIPSYLKSNIEIVQRLDTIYLKGQLDSIYTAERPLRIFFEIDDSSCVAGSNSSYTLLLYNNPFPQGTPSINFLGKRAFRLQSNPSKGGLANRYQWQFNGNTFNRQDTFTELKTPGIYKFRHIAFGERGCNDTTSDHFQSPDFPYVSINETPFNPCEGDTLEFSASFFHASTPPDYTWLNRKQGKNVQVILLKDTSIRVKAEFSDGTINFDTIEVKVIPAPEPSIHQLTQHCEGNILKLQAEYASSAFEDSATSYSWTYNSNLVSELPDVQIEDEGKMLLTIGYSNGCSRSVSKPIEFDLLYSPGKTLYAYCPDEDSIHFEIDTLSKLTSYWYLNKIQVAQGTNTFSMGNLSVNKEIVLVGLYIDTNVYCRFIDTLTSQLLPRDEIEFTGAEDLCEYDSIINLLDPSFVSPNYGHWLDSLNKDVDLVNGQFLDPALLPKSRRQELVYEVQHPLSNCITRKTASITVHPQPTIQFLLDTLELCAASTDYLMNDSRIAIPANGSWQGDGIVFKDDNYFFSTDGSTGSKKIYDLIYTVSDDIGCKASDSSTVKLGIAANPKVLSTTSGAVPITISFTDDRADLECEVDHWLWYFGDHVALPNCTTNVDNHLEEPRYCAYAVGQSVQHIYRDGGQYKVKLYVTNTRIGVTDSASYDSLSLTVNVDEVASISDRVVVYPNPITDYFTISQNLSQPFVHFELQNLLGQPIMSAPLLSETQRCEAPQALEGIFILVLFDGSRNATAHIPLLFE